MQTIRTIIWIAIAVLLTIFAAFNSGAVVVKIWPGYVAELPLSLLVLAAFGLGFVPPYVTSTLHKWRMRRKISQQEALIAQLRPAPMPAPAPAPNPAPLSSDTR